MHVGNVGADGEMDGDGDAEFVGGGQDAGVCVGDIDYRVMEKLAGGFTIAEAGAHGDFSALVKILAGFPSHAQSPPAQTPLPALAPLPDQGDLEIVAAHPPP